MEILVLFNGILLGMLLHLVFRSVKKSWNNAKLLKSDRDMHNRLSALEAAQDAKTEKTTCMR